MTKKSDAVPVPLSRRGLITPEDARHLRGRVELKEPGEETGIHTTRGREEVLIVLEGTATVYLKKRRVKVRAGHSLFIEEGLSHNVRNEGRERVRYIYVRSMAEYERGSLH